jgi:hypothetical protein
MILAAAKSEVPAKLLRIPPGSSWYPLCRFMGDGKIGLTFSGFGMPFTPAGATLQGKSISVRKCRLNTRSTVLVSATF